MSRPPSPLKSVAVRAGAGAGKTYHLTHEVLKIAKEFKEAHKSWPTLQVTTFTRKATQELSERLLQLALELSETELVDYVTQRSLLRISTIHGVLDDYLKKHGHHIGLVSDFTYLSEVEAEFISKKILKEILEQHSHCAELLKYFSLYQLYQLVRKIDGEVIDGLRPINQEDLDALLQEKLLSFKVNILEFILQSQQSGLGGRWPEVTEQINGWNSFISLERWDWKKLKIILDDFDKTKLKTKKEPASEILFENLKELLHQAQELIEPAYRSENFPFFLNLNKIFFSFYDLYQKNIFEEKKRINKIEISDLEKYSLKLMSLFPKTTELFSQEIDYWMIDEFQDTSPIQIQILDQLMKSTPHYFVGDPQQSIYLFRGAESSLFSKRIERINEGYGRSEFLSKNYRSSSEVLEFINSISEHLGPHFSKMEATKDAKKITSLASVQVTRIAKSEDKKYSFQVEMQNLVKAVSDLKQSGASLDSIAILVRSNDLLHEVSAALQKCHVNHFVHASGLYWQRQEVQDALSLLQVLVNPLDDLHLVHLLRTPYLSVQESCIVELCQKNPKPLWPEALLKMSSGEWGVPAQRLAHIYSMQSERGVVSSFELALRDLGFFDLHLSIEPSGRGEPNLWKLLQMLKEFERTRGGNLHQFIRDCWQAADVERAKEAHTPADEQAVQLMTIHASKGLQFDYVFLPFLSDLPVQTKFSTFQVDPIQKIMAIRTPLHEGSWETYASLFEQKVICSLRENENEEFFRVFYVALTRAQNHLWLSWVDPAPAASWAQRVEKLLSDLPESLKSVVLLQTLDENTIEDIPKKENLKLTKNKIPTLYTNSWQRFDYQTQSLAAVSRPSFFEAASYKNSSLYKLRGILFHRLMESLKYSVQVDRSALISQWFPGEEDKIAEGLTYIVSLQKPPLVQLIQEGEVEWSFYSKEMQGQIDLWGIVDGCLWIVDYKSGEKKLYEKAEHQLTIYAQVLKKYLNWSGPISCAIVYPFLQDTTIFVPKT